MALIDRPERARQLARAIASDLSLYHEKKLIEGIEKDSLFDVMREEIDEGRALYKSRVTPEGRIGIRVTSPLPVDSLGGRIPL